MARENGYMERPASSQELEEALDRLYKGQTNVALQARDLGDKPGTSQAAVPRVRRR